MRTRRLVGRAVTQADAGYMIESGADMRVQRWLFGKTQTPEQSRERLGRWIAMWEHDGTGFSIFRDAAGTVIGHGGVFASPREAGEYEIGYVVAPEFWGNGYATEIAAELMRVAVEDLALDRVIAIAQAGNRASRRVLEKIGMTLEREIPSEDGVVGALYSRTLTRAG